MTDRGVLVPAALSVTLSLAAAGLSRAADDARAPEARAARGLPPLGILNVAAVDLLWLRADTLFAENRWVEMEAAYELAGRLEPRLATSWQYRGFHLAYNLAGSAAAEAERDRWVLEGVRVLDEGLRSNPSAAGLRAYLGHVLFERSERWPSLRPRMRSARGRDPVDEAADLLGAAVAADPGNGLAVYWMTDALLARGRRALEAAGAAPCPAAAADFRRAAAALRAFAATAPDAGRDAAETLALGCDSMAAAAESADPAERKRLLERADAPQPGK